MAESLRLPPQMGVTQPFDVCYTSTPATLDTAAKDNAMKISSSLLPVFAAIVLSTFCASSAEAQATRTWVSGVGDDANPCSRTAPCKTFPGAISKTAAGGEINCLDSGGFGAVTITKSITIYCEGVVGGVLAAATNGIVVNAGAADVIVLRGLDIDGAGSGLNGIRFLAGAALHVHQCLIRNFRAAAPNGNGILFAPSTANAELYVSDTVLSNNSSGGPQAGIQVQPSGSGSANVVLKRVQVENGATSGLRAISTGASTTINATIADSIFAGNTIHGVAGVAAGTGSVQLLIDGSEISNNSNTGVRGDGSNTTVRIGNSNVSGNGVGTQFTNGAVLRSYGTNRIDGNVNNGPNPTTIPQK